MMSFALRVLFLCVAFLTPLFLVVVVPVIYPDALAESEKKKDYSNVRTRRVPVLGKALYEKLGRVHAILEEEENIKAAPRLLDGILRANERGRKPLNTYELANVWKTYAYYYYTTEQYDKAIDSYQKVIADPSAIPEALLTDTLYIIAQMYFVTERYQEAIDRLMIWMNSVKNPGPDVLFLIAQAYFQNDQRDKALESALAAVDLVTKRKTKMRESWYLLLRALYYEQEDYPKVADVLHNLIIDWPKRDYWVQLGGMYGQQEQHSNQIISLETAFLQEILFKEKEFTGLAYLLLGNEMPYKAAKVLEWGIENEYVEESSKNLELLGSAWQNAREIELALPILERAADLAEKGNIYARLASAYFNLHRFDDAIRTSEYAKSKGDVKRIDTLNIVLGMSLFNQQNFEKALDAFEEAGDDERSENLADQWQVHIFKEKRRLRHLAKEEKQSSLFDLLRGS